MRNFTVRKLYYSISEVSKITEVEPYVLRYWESEFEQLKPAKNRAGNRIYTNRDIKLILYIKKLLREEGYTIEGARRILKFYNPDEDPTDFKIEDGKARLPKITDPKLRQDLLEIKKFLEMLLKKLE